MTNQDYTNWFKRITNHPLPRPWQEELAASDTICNRLIRIPTGLGKTQGVLSAWAFNLQRNSLWSRRLVWCLPMRTLVEQTQQEATEIASRLPETIRPTVHVAMGGEDSGQWFLFPERPAIIIGTQDMLLSRALNRGYGSSRARWPVEYGLLNHDALWVMDEVQLMDVGLATSAQLQAFRDDDMESKRQLKPCVTWWMSATLQPDWLKSVDTKHRHSEWARSPIQIPKQSRSGGLFDVKKSISTIAIDSSNNGAAELARLVLKEHEALAPHEFGKITLVVLNTVHRACELYDAICKAGREKNVELVHSRFRPAERERWRSEFLSRTACGASVDRIIVATQVVEAGVDISAGCLITELAPWPSLIQRFGRCARYGGSGKVIVVDRGRDAKTAPPYSEAELESAWSAVESLSNAGLTSLENFEDSLSDERRRELYPYNPPHLLTRTEFDELFDTTSDLTGADIDISRFIRSGDERDLQVFWIDVPKSETPASDRRPNRRELCSVKFLAARDWLCGSETKIVRKPRLLDSKKGKAWVWDWIDGKWQVATRAALLPGTIVCVASKCGGYRLDRGFDPSSNQSVAELPMETTSQPQGEVNASDSRLENEALSFTGWKTIQMHGREVSELATEIAGKHLKLDEKLVKLLALAGLWHDVGKAHPAFQNMLLRERVDADGFRDQLWAKSDQISLNRPRYFADNENRDERKGFRHELASTLALFAILEIYQPDHPALLGNWRDVFEELGNDHESVVPLPATGAVQPLLQCNTDDFNLLAYLVASHHGKVRGALYASPTDQDYVDRDGRGLPIRGVRDGDQLPPVSINDAAPLPDLSLTLQPAALGLSPRTGASWRERCLELIETHGAMRLGFLEAILRAADVRASRLTTEDPVLAKETTP